MRIRTTALAVLALLTTSLPVPAKKKPIHPFFLQTPVNMNGAEIPAGLYGLVMESNNSNVQVSLWKDGQFVAAARGAWVKSGVKYTQDAALLRVNADGSRSLIEIRLAGAAKSIVLVSPGSTVSVTTKNSPAGPPSQGSPTTGGSSLREAPAKPDSGAIDSPATGR